MKIFCLYGVDVSTERSYYYSVVKKNHSVDNGTECTTSETTDLDSKSSAPPAKTCSTESPSRTPSFVSKVAAKAILKQSVISILMQLLVTPLNVLKLVFVFRMGESSCFCSL